MNSEQISPDDAIKRAKWIITLPAVLILMFGFLIGSFFLYIFLPAVIAFMAAFVFAACSFIYYRGYALIKWKLWAYPKVTDINALKEDALKLGILQNPTFLEKKLAYRSKTKEAEIAQLELEALKRLQEINPENDPSLGDTYIVYADRPFLLVVIVAAGVAMIYGWSRSLPPGLEKSIGGAVILGIGGFVVLRFFISLKRKKDIALLFSTDGLYSQIEKKAFYTWDDVKDIEIRTEGSGEDEITLPYIITSTGEIRVSLNSISNQRILHVYRTYRNRHLRNRPHITP